MLVYKTTDLRDYAGDLYLGYAKAWLEKGVVVGKGTTHESTGTYGISGFLHPLLAVLDNRKKQYKVWECEGEGPVKRSGGMCWFPKLTSVRPVNSEFSVRQKLKFAIACVLDTYQKDYFVEWAKHWHWNLSEAGSGEDRWVKIWSASWGSGNTFLDYILRQFYTTEINTETNKLYRLSSSTREAHAAENCLLAVKLLEQIKAVFGELENVSDLAKVQGKLSLLNAKLDDYVRSAIYRSDCDLPKVIKEHNL